MTERLYIFDTTLRDGAQTQGVDFSVADKHKVATLLDELGVDYVEGGYPGANPTDTDFFANPPDLNAKFTAFGMTRRAGRSAANDPGLSQILQANTPSVCLVAKSWDYHVKIALKCEPEENIRGIRDSIKRIVANNQEAMLDCEHFFDGYKANPAYALECTKAAYEAGARWVILCDTNGGTLPHEITQIIEDVTKHIPGDNLGIHAHDDTGNAVANSLNAVLAGVRQIQGTMNGLGERCGNANLCSLIPTLKLKPFYSEKFDIGVSDDALTQLTPISRTIDELLNRPARRHDPYIGEAAFVTKAGIHASALVKEPQTYEHVPPETIGNRRRVLMSDQAGKSNLLSELKRLKIEVLPDDPRLNEILKDIKQREAQGYAYEAADASLELYVRSKLEGVPKYFEVERFKVSVERRYNAKGKLVTFSEAVVKVHVGDESFVTAEEGSGPVNALDLALRKDLGIYQPYIEGIHLTDYRVRILDGGTEAITRVLLETADETGHRWMTIGVSPNIIDASFQALIDSITYRLLKKNAPSHK